MNDTRYPAPEPAAPADQHLDEIEALVPPGRLGRLLAEARVARGLTVAEASSALHLPLDDYDLLQLETGRRAADEVELRALAALYGLQLTEVVPPRSRLVVDLAEGRILAGAESARLGRVSRARARDEVLTRYLGLVYAMRGVEPGAVVPLRFDDVEVLAAALDGDHLGIEQELHDLMRAAEPVRRRMRALRGRLLLPVAGIVVAATAGGALLLVPADDTAAEEPVPAPVVAVVDAPAGADAPAEIGTAVVQERLADGTPGPVEVRGG